MVILEELKKEATRVLEEGIVKYLVGYKRGSNGFMAVPAFIRDPSEVKNLIWEGTCVHNLTRYLVAEKRKLDNSRSPDDRPIAIIVKGCDSRALNVLLQEKFIRREQVYIIGVSCESAGVIDPKKVAKKFKARKPQRVTFDKGNRYLVRTRHGNIKVPVREIMADRCLECNHAFPLVYDVVLGEKNKRKESRNYNSLTSFDQQMGTGRWDYWKEHMGRCIRCYACRSVCPMCYCDECVVDSINYAVNVETSAQEKANKIKWIEKSPLLPENVFFHLIRALHLAGRCIDCGECQRVCPVQIPLRYLNKKMEQEAETQFNYQAGMGPDHASLISSFNDSDPQEFIL